MSSSSVSQTANRDDRSGPCRTHQVADKTVLNDCPFDNSPPESTASTPTRSRRFIRRLWRRVWFAMIVGGLVLGGATSLAPSAAGPLPATIVGELPTAFVKRVPTSVDDLRTIENHVSALAERVKPATVGIRVGRAFGSGVIISPDGYVLTAGHVSGAPNRTAEVTLPDGSSYVATTLGQNRTADSGLLKLEGSRTDWPYAEMAADDDLEIGHWCLALGHPGGVKKDREAVLRLGRVLTVGDELVRTDCELVGGDSGGPLFDMHGRVIAINSRISTAADMNFHVPVAIYLDEWDRLEAGESFFKHSGARLGLRGDKSSNRRGMTVTEVFEGGSAERAGLEVGDIIVTFEGERVTSIADLRDLVGLHPPGSLVELEFLREGRPMVTETRLGGQ